MAESKMMNFRAKPHEVDLIDQAARSLGMNRSQFIRNAVQLAIAAYKDRGQVRVAVEVPASKGAGCKEGDVRGCTLAQWSKLPTGVQVCSTCGVRK